MGTTIITDGIEHICSEPDLKNLELQLLVNKRQPITEYRIRFDRPETDLILCTLDCKKTHDFVEDYCHLYKKLKNDTYAILRFINMTENEMGMLWRDGANTENHIYTFSTNDIGGFCCANHFICGEIWVTKAYTHLNLPAYSTEALWEVYHLFYEEGIEGKNDKRFGRNLLEQFKEVK